MSCLKGTAEFDKPSLFLNKLLLKRDLLILRMLKKGPGMGERGENESIELFEPPQLRLIVTEEEEKEEATKGGVKVIRGPD